MPPGALPWNDYQKKHKGRPGQRKGWQVPREEWVQYMAYFVIERWCLCWRALLHSAAHGDSHARAVSCGVDLVEEPVPHYSGNFWPAGDGIPLANPPPSLRPPPASGT